MATIDHERLNETLAHFTSRRINTVTDPTGTNRKLVNAEPSIIAHMALFNFYSFADYFRFLN